MRSKVLVSLLVSGVFRNEMEVLPADDESSVHFGGNDGASQDAATNGNKTGEWALLVCKERVSMNFRCPLLVCASSTPSQIIPSILPPPSPQRASRFALANSSIIAEFHIPM